MNTILNKKRPEKLYLREINTVLILLKNQSILKFRLTLASNSKKRDNLKNSKKK